MKWRTGQGATARLLLHWHRWVDSSGLGTWRACVNSGPDCFVHALWQEWWRRQELQCQGERVCTSCGCSDSWACPGGCFWPKPLVDICSVCWPDVPDALKR